MQVQAQHPSTAAFFAPNYPRNWPRLAGVAAPLFHINDASAVPAVQVGDFAGTILRQKQMFINGMALQSGEPESGLTCNASSSRKRAFDGDPANTILQPNLQRRQTRLRCVAPDVSQGKAAAAAATTTPCAGIPSLLSEMTYDKIRLLDSAMTSTSGRPPAEAPLELPSAMAASPTLMEQLLLQLYCQSLELDAFISHQNERIRSRFEESWKCHHRALLSAMEQGIIDRLREKEAELESATHRNAELEEKIRQLASENQIWFNVARSKETIVSTLRAALEQVLLQSPAAPEAPTLTTHPHGMEAFGESDCVAPPGLPAEDAESCCYGDEHDKHDAAATGDVQRRSACKVCGKRDGSTLLLPCRHLCVCEQCDGGIDACPVCGAAKSASLRVFLC